MIALISICWHRDSGFCHLSSLKMWQKSGTSHYCDVRMGTMVSQITSLMIVYLTVHSGSDQRKHQSSAALAFERVIHRSPVNSPHKWPVTRKMLPFDDVIMNISHDWSDNQSQCISINPLVEIFVSNKESTLVFSAIVQRWDGMGGWIHIWGPFY